jgi:hypothetical protein
MSEISLETPWRSEPVVAPQHRPMSGVDVLPGYASFKTVQTPSTLTGPWSGHKLAIPQHAPIESLDDMLL